jgi:hypothetical protein
MYNQVYFAPLAQFLNKFRQEPEAVSAQLAQALGGSPQARTFATRFVESVTQAQVTMVDTTMRHMIENLPAAAGMDLGVAVTFGAAVKKFLPVFNGALKVNQTSPGTWEVAVFFLTQDPAQEQSARQEEYHSWMSSVAENLQAGSPNSGSTSADSSDVSKAINDALSGEDDPSATAVNLPPGLESGFGGIDLAKAALDPLAIRAGTNGLFNLRTGTYNTVTFRWPSPTGISDQVKEDFQVPTALSCERVDNDQIISVEGQSKQDFADKFAGSASFKAEGAGGAYSGEFKRSFQTNSETEDLRKYAITFRQVESYSVTLCGSPADLLSDVAKTNFASKSAAELLDTYGTHFTKTAIFGGLRICAATVDIHDHLEENELTQALAIKASGVIGKGSAEGSSSSERVNKIHEEMTVTYTGHFGGQADTADDAKWRASLNLTPVLVGYELEPLSSLVTDNAQLKKEIEDEIAGRVGRKPLKTYPLVAMKVPISFYTSDHGTGASRDVSVAKPSPKPGWYYTGHWALPIWNAFPDGFQTLIFQNWPGTGGGPSPAIKPTQGFERRWGMSGGWGLFSAIKEDGYYSVGDLFEHTDNAWQVPDQIFYGIVRGDLVEDCGYLSIDGNANLWQDSGSGAQDDGSAWAFANYDDPNTPDWQKTIFDTVGTGQAPHMFVAVSGYGQPAPAKRIKPDAYTLLPGKFLFS